MVTQADLDALASRLESAVSSVKTEIEGLEKQISEGKESNELDLTGLNQAASDLEGLEVPSDTGGTEAAPTNADGTAAENTTDPSQA